MLGLGSPCIEKLNHKVHKEHKENTKVLLFLARNEAAVLFLPPNDEVTPERE
jgi:hypothetical protein